MPILKKPVLLNSDDNSCRKLVFSDKTDKNIDHFWPVDRWAMAERYSIQFRYYPLYIVLKLINGRAENKIANAEAELLLAAGFIPLRKAKRKGPRP